MGALADPEAATSAPVNPLEAEDDAEGVWRGWQEEALAGAYARVWDRANAFLHLRAPTFECVLDWRRQQEETTLGLAPGALPPDRRAWVARFIQHYERITRRMIIGHIRPGAVVDVNKDRQP